MSDRVGLLLVAGAPGSGKTALIARWLVDPELADSALLVNELGDVAIDHQMVSSGGAPARAVTGGCACCSASAAFVQALEALSVARMQRKVTRFGRLIVEAAGLADPGALRALLEGDPMLRANYRLEGIVVTVDAAEGLRSLEAHRECLAQVLHADAIVLTKTDIADENEVDRLQERLAELNPHAHVIRSVDGNAQPQLVLAAMQAAPEGDAAPRGAPIVPDPAVRTFTLRPGTPVEADTLRSRIEAFLDRHGSAVIRMKGLVAIDGRPGPAVVQAAAGQIYPMRLLPRWPDSAASALVIVARGLTEAQVRASLEELAAAQ